MSFLKSIDELNKTKWSEFLNSQITQPYYDSLISNVDNAYQINSLFPSSENVFRSLLLTDPFKIDVIILGQDPYINDNQANGLAFSVFNDCSKIPPSLKNIFKEIEMEFNFKRTNYDLSDWANQNVLLLNTILTVQKYKSLSCDKWGWQYFTFNLIQYVLEHNKNVIIICLGDKAKKFLNKLNLTNHYLIYTSHPSPLSAYRGFLGSGIFKKINTYLVSKNKSKINW